MLINVKMSTIVGILTFISRINLVLSRVEYDEKSFITLGQVYVQKTPLNAHADMPSSDRGLVLSHHHQCLYI